MMRQLLKLLLCCCLQVSAAAHSSTHDQNNRQRLDSYYLYDKDALPFQEVLNVAQQVVSDRHLYSENTIAKAFALLSEIAFARGNAAAALQFAQYGNEVGSNNVELQLNLLLQVARAYYAQGNYIALKDTAHQAAWLSEQAQNINYHLQALAYSVVAYALSADYALAIAELSKVERLLNQNQNSVDQITLLEIIAEAHFNLAEYENSIELLKRVVKLRSELAKTSAMARTFQLMALAYYQLQQYDDAYNAFWQSLQFSKQYQLDIRAAFAELGLGQVLYQQQKYTQAKAHLLSADATFKQNNLTSHKLSVKISLAKVFYALSQESEAEQHLLSAQLLAENVTLTADQIELYAMLTDYHLLYGQLPQAIDTQSQYLKHYQSFYPKASVKQSLATAAKKTRDKTKQLALNLAEQSQLRIEYSEKYYQQQTLITVLSVALTSLFVGIIFWRLRQHQQQRSHNYQQLEISKTYLAQPAATKRWYQQQYKIARKYQYDIVVAYLVVTNWQELSFHFNAKTLADVSAALATIVNEHLDDEDYAGIISDGEYLFLCPHQTTTQVSTKFEAIKKAIKTRFFANLGDYSVNISLSIDSPSVQDIDPYVFLSRISESIDPV
ncbi:Putative cell wall-binding protein [Colwellia chukchiensis]|uniref:Putative cell wall-binding protein n=1 Tax=Colwellia chukchiensis TaxID=641665 RepID=A0A1H7P6S8_9GAMM|nr:hypothetical protein [Colwellia chukchiensis]SEL31108.1 Putative cell wall-binding protein [Colwellia chukchiensis]